MRYQSFSHVGELVDEFRRPDVYQKIMKSYVVTCCLKEQQLGLGVVASVCKCQSFNAVNSCRAVMAVLGSEHVRTLRGGNFVAL